MNLRQAIKALRRARKPIQWCDRRIRGKYSEKVFSSGTVSRGALSLITWCGVPFPEMSVSFTTPVSDRLAKSLEDGSYFERNRDVLKQKPIVLPLKSYLTRAVS